MADDNFSVVTDELQTINSEATNTADESNEESQGSTTEEAKDDSKEADETATSEEATTEAETKEGHSRFQKRIDKLTKQREDAIRENERLKQELEAIKSLPKKQATKELNPLDFESYEDYIEALNSQPAKEEPKQEVKKEAKQEEPKVPDAVYRKLDDSFEESREKYKDFDEVVFNAQAPFTPEMVMAISELDNAGEVSYYLAKNKDELKRLSGLSPFGIAKELGKLEDKIMAPKPQPEKKVTKAPDPINPVASGGDVVTKDPEKMSFKEYEAYMNSQKTKKGFW